ncbi:MAG: SurA N-terminal domain-containing protein [Akkermansiaceae bacterium]
MRKYTGLMIVVFILLGAGFLFTMNDIGTGSGSGGGSGPAVLEVYGQSIDEQEYYRRGDRTLQLASELGLHNYVNFLIIPDIQQLMQANQLMRMGYPNYYVTMSRNIGQQDLNRFIANRMTLQRSMGEMGLYASEEEVTDFLKTSPRFAPTGQYDAGEYASFVDKRLGRLGMTEKHLREVVRESLCLSKLIQLVGSGLTAPRSSVKDQLEARSQTVTLARVVLNRDDFVEKEDPTEEEIKTYWEAHKDAYKTEEQRRIAYILLDVPKDETKDDKKDDKAAEGTVESDAEKDRKAAEDAAKKTAEEEKKKARTAVMRKIEAVSDSIIQKINDKQELKLEEIVKQHGEALVRTELFTRSAPPEKLKGLVMRGGTSRGKSLTEEIFTMPMTSDKYDLVSKPLPVGENAWIIFRLDEVIEPVLLDYTAARGKARANLIGENATEKVKAAADEAREKISAALVEGKSFDDAAKELALTPVQVGPYSFDGIPPKNEPSHRQLHQTAQGLNPGQVSEAIHENDRSVIIFVEKREIEDTEENKNRIDSMVTGSKGEFMVRTFLNWRNTQFNEAKLSGPFTEKK